MHGFFKDSILIQLQDLATGGTGYLIGNILVVVKILVIVVDELEILILVIVVSSPQLRQDEQYYNKKNCSCSFTWRT